MNSILNKIHKNHKKNLEKNLENNTIIEEQINLELELKIQIEKRKQLELIKDIKKIELNIKQKELYALSKRNKCISLSSSNSDSIDNIDSDVDSNVESDIESDINSNIDSDIEPGLNLESKNMQSDDENEDIDENNYGDTISLYSCDSSVYSYNEIEINNI